MYIGSFLVPIVYSLLYTKKAKAWVQQAPLSDLVGECGHTKLMKANMTTKKPWHCVPVHQQAFHTVKAMIAGDVTLAYPVYSQGFEINTESSKLQLGAMVTQNNRCWHFSGGNQAQHNKNIV